jgi:transforming growth factor-beta-induced protein
MVMILITGSFFTSCSNEDAPLVDNMEIEKSIIEVLDSYSNDDVTRRPDSKKPTFKTLSVALAKTGLAGTVSSNILTVFAPTDAAFAKLGLDQKNILSALGKDNLIQILTYHAVPGRVYSTDLANGFVPTLNGAAVEVNLEMGVMINTSNVEIADIKARNGVIHAIDNVLLPPSQNIVELAQSILAFSILVEAVVKAGLAETLAEGTFTVFAPTNDAFIALLGELGASGLDDIPIDVLTAVLLYHVADGRIYSSDLSSGMVNTLGGSFDLDLSTLTITDAQGRDAGLVADMLNVQATNGVVHVIDRVILP